ncbi:MAG: DUF2520 domain-containing protein [Bdellovibrionales bacterium]|nr:DUF2520 domain-containing protein [Bdellovibrionales bacterium]
MNRQVPFENKYLIVGSGRLAKHLSLYFKLLKLQPLRWSRSNSQKFNTFHHIKNNQLRLFETLKHSTHALLAISDNAIDEFAKCLPNHIVKIHFSGSLSTSHAQGLHPLMTFTNELYELETYIKIPFIIEENNMSNELKHWIPEFKNPNFTINKDLKGLYHALCVVGGNFTNILWREVVKSFQDQLHLPKEVLLPYLERTFKNIINNPLDSLTGPLQRGDFETLSKNTQALAEVKLDNLYKEFMKVQNLPPLKEQ